MPPRQPKPGEPLSYGDRLVSALVGGICGFGTMVVIWFVVMYAGGRAGDDVAFDFYWTWVVAGVVALLAFLAGPERMLDAFEQIWRVIGLLFFWRTDRSDFRTRSGKRR